MIKSAKIILIILVAILIAPLVALAHQPRIVSGSETVKIENPEVSQAFYGELKGQPQIFEIDSSKNFLLYVNILVPKLPDIKKDISAEIYRGQELIAALDGPRFEWIAFHEPFGGDDYWQGPEFKQSVGAEKYQIKVFSPDNLGKYSLAIGEQEKFPLGEILKTIVLLPILKKDFFNKCACTAYFNYTGLFLLGALMIIFVVVFSIVKLVKKAKRNNPSPSEN